MRFDPKSGLDATGWKRLHWLQQNARLSFAELGRQLSLSAPAVAERMKRLEESGHIQGYRAEVNGAALGLGVSTSLNRRHYLTIQK